MAFGWRHFNEDSIIISIYDDMWTKIKILIKPSWIIDHTVYTCVYIPLLFYSFHSDSLRIFISGRSWSFDFDHIFRHQVVGFCWVCWEGMQAAEISTPLKGMIPTWSQLALEADSSVFTLEKSDLLQIQSVSFARIASPAEKPWALIMVPDNDQTWPLPIEFNMNMKK